ncbi:MAG: YuiA family protein [Gammaproteobacteria bacterium]|jgi:hypothetical protein
MIELSRDAYQKLIDSDVWWLLEDCDATCERDHIEAVLIDSVERIYGHNTRIAALEQENRELRELLAVVELEMADDAHVRDATRERIRAITEKEEPDRCPECDGKGYHLLRMIDEETGKPARVHCPDCDGTGKRPNKPKGEEVEG